MSIEIVPAIQLSTDGVQWGAPGAKLSVAPGASVCARLASMAGVMAVSWSVEGWDEGPAAIPWITKGAIGEVVWFKACGPGSAGLLRVVINHGIEWGRVEPSLSATVKWYVPTELGHEVAAGPTDINFMAAAIGSAVAQAEAVVAAGIVGLFPGPAAARREIERRGSEIARTFRALYETQVRAMVVRVPDDRAVRREIERILGEDAWAHPLFARARQCAVLMELEELAREGDPPEVLDVCRMLDELHAYEIRRGGQRAPARVGATLLQMGPESLGAYERERSRSGPPIPACAPERDRAAREAVRKAREQQGRCGRQSTDGRWCKLELLPALVAGHPRPHPGDCQWERAEG